METTILKKNIDKYMDLNGYRFYYDLLTKIYRNLGMNQSEARKLATKEKSNFSKMLNGNRPLKYEYIIPLEEIFGVPLAKLLNEDLYKIDVNKENIPFLKSFRYFAHKDDPVLYEELDKMTTPEGDDILNNSDEYQRCFMDYLIEYRAYNGLKYLINKHHLKFDDFSNLYFIDDEPLHYSASLKLEIAKFIIDSNNPKTFSLVYNPFNYFMKNYWFDKKSIASDYVEDKFIEAILNNDKIFNLLFEEKTSNFEAINNRNGIKIINKNDEYPAVLYINPLLNIVFDYCLNHLSSYKKQTKEIIEFGIKFNKRVIKKINPNFRYQMGNLGTISDGRFGFFGNLIYTNIKKTDDEEITKLLKQLQKI